MADATHDPVTSTARAAGLVACRRCARVWPIGKPECGRCGAPLVSRDWGSIQRVWAWLALGILAYIPANIYPMLRSTVLFSTTESTIVGGAVDLIHHGAVGVALIVLIASVAIPLGKFCVIAYLAISLRRRRSLASHSRHKLYELIEFVGRWSMIDVFVVAILSALVQLSTVATIQPGPAAIAFAVSVIATMLAAQSFDPRLLWNDEAPAR